MMAVGMGLILVIGFILLGRAMIGNEPRSYFEEAHREAFIAELNAFIENPLTRISIQKENPWDSWDFEYSFSDPDKLREFTAAARQADMALLAEDSSPILGTMMTLSNGNSELRVIATVHRNDLQDIYISNVFPVETTPGTFTRGPGMEIRLPGLGRWLMMAAPVACGADLRDKCATGDVQPEDIK